MFAAYAQRLNAIYLRITEPHPRVADPRDRYASRLFSALMLVLAFLILPTQILPYLPSQDDDLVTSLYLLLTIFMFVAVLLAYRYARQGCYRPLARVISLLFVGIILFSAYPDVGLWELHYLGYMLLPLIIASMFLPVIYSWGLFFLFLAGVVLLDLAVSDVTLLDLLLGPVTFVLLHFALITIAAGYFRKIEAGKVEQEVETERLKIALAQEQDLNSLKDHIMSTISHEFRNPLAAILSAAELLQTYEDRMTAERRAELYERIQGQVHHLTNMVSDVMLIRRMQTGTLPIERTQIDLHEFIMGIVREFETFTAPDHTYAVECGEVSHNVSVDTRLLRYILVNLVSNAAKYSPAGSPITIKVPRSDRELEIVVVDRGIGIKPEDRPHIFEPFYRGTNAGAVSGSGLGLKIVKDCVDLHGGKIGFTSDEDGTAFTVALPVLQPVVPTAS